ncbi:MAG: type III PLP-dependent enzyme [Ardenticatenia bacterium]|nr:type III PLP-dependent enzyme [Ardenticatenia bacterium]
MTALLSAPRIDIGPTLPSIAFATPYLLMDLDTVAAAYRRLQAALPGVDIHYAMKCNPDRRVLTTLGELGCRFEIASAPELDLLLQLGFAAADQLYSNPVKPQGHIQFAHEAGLNRFAVDSMAELRKIATVAPGAAVYARLAVSDGTSEVPSEGKFGVDGATARDLLLAAREMGLRPHGLTFHVGSQMLDPAPWERAIAHSSAVMRDLARQGLRLAMLDIGGGFPATYASPVRPIEDFGRRIVAALAAHLPYAVAVVAEPGRALVAEAGLLVSQVIGVAERAGRTWVHVDVGAFNGMMEALETQNQLRYPVRDSRLAPCKQLVHLTGPSCDSQDTLLYDVPLSWGIADGDAVYIGSAGAYTTSYASNFNGFDIPMTYCV